MIIGMVLSEDFNLTARSKKKVRKYIQGCELLSTERSILVWKIEWLNNFKSRVVLSVNIYTRYKCNLSTFLCRVVKKWLS